MTRYPLFSNRKTKKLKTEKLPLERSFNFHQKLILIGFSLIPLMVIIELIDENLKWQGYLIYTSALLLFLYLISLAFSRKGLLKKGNKLYRAKFFNGLTLYKNQIYLKDRPIVSILQFNKRQKYAFFSAAKPDLDKSFNTFEIFVLNERHIKRDSVMYFKKKENSVKAIEFLTTDFPLKHEVFSPNFAR